MEKIDITIIDSKVNQETIFNRFDILLEGSSLTFQSDVDPGPLFFKLITAKGQTFTWDLLQEGPFLWEVKITKNQIPEESETIGQMAAKDFRKAEVFRKFGLDFCCGGKKTLEKACERKGISAEEVKKELDKLDSENNVDPKEYNSWELDFLADYIVTKHHKYINDSHPLILEYCQKVSRVHGALHPEVIEITRYYIAVAEELHSHMIKEEEILFPFIKDIVQAYKIGKPIMRPHFGSIQNPINMMESEHLSAGSNMDQIKLLSNNFTPPENACNSFRVLYAKLKEYELDLHHHIHLENNILFKKAMDIEKEIEFIE